jgi:hypothetical protein
MHLSTRRLAPLTVALLSLAACGGSDSGGGATPECSVAADCGADTACRTWACTAGQCASADTDVPADDGVECTLETCVAGSPLHPPAVADAPCTQDGGAFCDGAGACVQCNDVAQCAGALDECQAPTCTAGTCGTWFADAGTPLASQVTGDCQQLQCDGSGGVTSASDDADLPGDDGNPCTGETCTAGAPGHPYLAKDTACAVDGGAYCDAAGGCVQCNRPDQCPGVTDECQAPTCLGGTCSTAFTSAGVAVASQVAGDCRENQCDGTGGVVSVALNTDLPADDGNTCTADTCSSGAPVHPPVSVNTACTQNGGSYCDGASACVQCTAAAQCPGVDSECAARVCNAGACSVAYTAAGTPLASQTAGDCQELQCNGSGGTVSVNRNDDVPADDGNSCTDEACDAGSPTHPPRPANTACAQNGGSVCDASGSCVGCNADAQCPPAANECATPRCNANVCGFLYVTDGTPTSAQVMGDCQQRQCSGGSIVDFQDDTDRPDDGNPCTDDFCSSGVPGHAPTALGTTCGSGLACDGATNCVALPAVASTNPADGATATLPTALAITFTKAMTPTTLTAQTTPGDCTGSIQLSDDGFASCGSFSLSTPTMTGGNITATLQPSPGLSPSRAYAVRVTTDATDMLGLPLAAPYVSTSGFSTTFPAFAATSGVVISQIYGGGGAAGSYYRNDFIELYNLGTSAVNLAGWSVQYTTSGGTTWQATPLSGSIPPGGYFLVQEAVGASGTAALPTPDVTGTIALSATAGKVALVSTTALLTGGCPTGGSIVDFVGFGSSATCFEGTGPTPAPSNTTSVQRKFWGCSDTNANATDLVAGAVTPRNTATAYACPVAAYPANETGYLEAAWCAVTSPLSEVIGAGVTVDTIYGQVRQPGMTEAAGANAAVTAQVGWGPVAANPLYEPGWTWYPTAWVQQAGEGDEYAGSFTAPSASGTYRYAFRFSFDSGAHWTYCDGDVRDGGAGADPGFAFEPATVPVLTVW